MPNVMGRDSFDLELAGNMQGNNTITVTGTVAGTQMRFLPARLPG